MRTVVSRDIAAKLQTTGLQRHAAFVYLVLLGIGYPCYYQPTLVKTRYPLTGIMCPYSGLKLTAHRGQVFFQVSHRPCAAFFDVITGSCLINLSKTGQDC